MSTAVTAALQRVHLVGVGGAGMSGIARVLVARGAVVSGSDARDSRTLAALRALGVRVHVGHAAEQLGDATVVVTSTAVRESNVEVVAARAAGLPVLRRAEALAELMRGLRGVCIAGTHGKTTTTSMTARALQHCGMDPSFAIGGDLDEPGSNAHHGVGDIFVAESDESDGSFLLLEPEVAVVTNVEADHLDHWPDLAAIERAFTEFSSRVPSHGLLVTCLDDVGSRALGERSREAGVAVRTYGVTDGADVRAEGLQLLTGGGSVFDVVADGRRLGTVELAVPGLHNVCNALAAITVALHFGGAFAQVVEGLARFGGARRRFEPKGEAGGVRVFDDYSHHPTEVRAALLAARQVAGQGRVVVVFQPHLYSRTVTFAAEFGEALALADEVVVMDVYGAREDPVAGVTGALVAEAVRLPPGAVVFEPSWSSVAAHVTGRVRKGDVLITMGAGDVTQLGEVLLEELALLYAETDR
jgi:UDP-N-acetylmuramate--alanine ligase